MAEITLDKVSKRFSDGTVAVKAVSFTIQNGEFFILVGPSGCGKSTLLNMIVGLEGVSEGEIRMDDKVINDIDPKDRNMAMVFQSYAIYPHMTVWENMAFPLKLTKIPKDEIAKRVTQAAEILGLSELLERKPRSLSGGQRQRVAMGRAIVRRPAVFLLDEPLSNLDAKLRVTMRNKIARIQRRFGTTTLYVTHDQTEAMTLGDRIAVMHQGEIQQIGTPQELYEQPRNLFVAGFIGSPTMNFLPAEWDGEYLKLPMMELALPVNQCKQLPEGQRTLVVGVRPEDIQDANNDCGDSETSCFQSIVEHVEWLGSQCDVYFEIAGLKPGPCRALPSDLNRSTATADHIPMVARVDIKTPVTEGQKRYLRLDANKLHLFDVEMGKRLVFL